MPRKKTEPDNRPPTSALAYGSKSLRQLKRIAKTGANRARRHLRMMQETPANFDTLDARRKDACIRVESAESETRSRLPDGSASRTRTLVRLKRTVESYSGDAAEVSILAKAARMKGSTS